MRNPWTTIQPALPVAARGGRDAKLASLASDAATSAFHFHRTFTAVAGETPKQHASRLALERAAALLLTGRRPVLEIALESGFESHDGFTRAFRRHFGLTPSAYRARGFASRTTPEAAAAHERWVRQIGPCVGFYHLPQNGMRPRNSMAYTIAKKEVAEVPVLVATRRVSHAEIGSTIGEVLTMVFQYAQRNGLALAGRSFVRYASVGAGLMTIEPGMCVVFPVGDVAASVAGGPSAADAVRRDTLPGGPVA